MIHTREVASPSARAETWLVARAAFFIAYGSALWVSAETHAAAPVVAPPLAPFERRASDLAPEDQRVHRALQEGIVEAERRRSTTGRWPSAEDLAREAIPPFAPDPLDRARFSWSTVTSGAVVNYLGVPRADPARASFMVIIVEPDPGALPDPAAPVDETHHRLADGTMIQVSVWMGPPPATTDRAVKVPAPGQQQIVGRPR